MTEEDLDEASSNALKQSLEDFFGTEGDYRRAGSVQYRLVDILFITICAVICGADNLKAVARYAVHKKSRLAKILQTNQNMPSYTTFWTVFSLLNPLVLEKSFITWVQSKFQIQSGDVVSIDGKAQRGTAQKGRAHSFVNIVSAWASKSHLTLGQLKVDSKSNEITAVPKLLDMIDVKGAVVTIDAMGCQTEIADKIISMGADYALALKKNQGGLFDEIENYFNQAEAVNFEGVQVDAIGFREVGHGRIEKREIYATEDIDWLPQKNAWRNLRSIIMIKSERLMPGAIPVTERRFYISSLPAIAFKIAAAIRQHWGIENQAHWILDVGFREDEQNACAGHIPENMSLMRRIALNLLKQEKTAKCGIAIKRQIAGWDNDYLLRVLGVKSFS